VAFEKEVRNVTQAVKDARVPFPVVMDNDFRIWNTFNNEYWPAVYLLDGTGKVRYVHAGEGAYERTEREIQALLAESGKLASRDLTPVEILGPEVSADPDTLGSPETYVGISRADTFAGGRLVADASHEYAAPERLRRNTWSLAGAWTAGTEYATADKADAAITYAFHARDVNLIMGSGPGSSPLRFRVTIDGRKPGADHGVDIDENGEGIVA